MQFHGCAPWSMSRINRLFSKNAQIMPDRIFYAVRAAMRKARYTGRSWPVLRENSSGPFSPRRTYRHGRAFEAEVLAQCVASVFCTEYTAPLQLGHHECHEVVEIARKQCRGENEAVAGLGLEPGLAVIGDLRRGADQGAAWGDAINELLHSKVFVRSQSFPSLQELAVDLGL